MHEQDVVAQESTIELIMNRESFRIRKIRRVAATIILSFLVTMWGVNIHSFVTQTHRYTSQHQQPPRKLIENAEGVANDVAVEESALTPATPDHGEEPNASEVATPSNEKVDPFWYPVDN